MARNVAKDIVIQILDSADITVNGSRATDIQVHDERFYDTVLQKRGLGFGESYMAEWWDCEELDQCIARLLRSGAHTTLKFQPSFIFKVLVHRFFNFQTKHRAKQVAERHYDVGNDLFQYMLDKNMVYSCGYWKDASDLDEAQINKLDLVCKKLHLKPGMRVLDIGCGWGSFAKYAAEHYGVSVEGVTISAPQIELARQKCKGLPVKIRLQDYRDIKGHFDRIVSIGMFEHVGYKNYRRFMKKVKNCLNPDGLFLLHTMGSNYSVVSGNEWLVKYIFPNGMLPSVKQIEVASEKLFIVEDWHNLGTYYYPTLKSWHKNFNQNWDALQSNYSPEFKRMWNFYLMSCAGSALTRGFQVWQIVFSNGSKEVYHTSR